MMDTVKICKKGSTKIVAHRGLSGIEPENTNASFIAAGNRSYYGIETDIYRTCDGHFVINHDGNLARVGGVDMAVENATLEQLQSVILLDKNGKRDRVDLHPTTLENYVSICKKYGKHSVLELKSAFSDEEIERIIEIIKSYDQLDDLTFISFNYENLKKVRKVLPHQSCQLLFGEVKDEIIDMLSRDSIDADICYPYLTADNIKAMHDLGIKVNCWTVDDAEAAQRLIEMGVDFITSNILE